MTTDPLAGTAPGFEGGRVVGVRGPDLIAEAVVGPDGRWELPTDEPLDRLVFQLKERRLAAVAVAADGMGAVSPPQLATLRLTLRGAAPGAVLWLDPEALEGFPDELMPVLHRHADGTVDLHVGEWTAHEPLLTLAAQPGRYRLSGGLVALHPTSRGQSVVALRASGDDPAQLADSAGAVHLDVTEDASYEVEFAGGS
jgi:hypothetical protein